MFKIITSILAVCFLGIFILTRIFFQEYCSNLNWCDYDLRNSLIRPVMYLTPTLFVTLLLISLYPNQIVRSWFIKIFSWFFPLTIIQVVTTDLYKSGMFIPTKADVAWGNGVILFYLTAIFLVVTFVISYRNNVIKKKDFWKLLLIIPFAIVLYFGKDIFFW